jgi:SAM-dependent methyltransferase
MKPEVEEKMRRQAEYAGSGTILDIGCSARPNPFVTNAYGIDILPPKNIPIGYKEIKPCNLNIQPIPYPDSMFDVVMAGDVIEHLENPSQFLREVNRVMKFGGKVIISTPQANDWWTTLHNWFFRRWIRDPDPGEHLQNWTILDMVRLMKKSGFAVKKIEGLHIRFPFIRLRISCRRFPVLCWQVYYLATKETEPNTAILAHADGHWSSVEQPLH